MNALSSVNSCKVCCIDLKQKFSVAKVLLFFEKSKFFLILQGDGGLELRVLGLEFRGIADITHPLHSEPKTINSKKNYRGRSMAYLSAR